MESENIEIQQAVKLKETGKKRADAVKLQRGDNAARKKRKQMELPSPATDRPIRERKSIERLIVSPQKEVKEFKILKGTGTPLKNIPNVVFKLSKLKGSDEAVQTLHRVIFGRVSSKYTAKANILQFSGFVWNENEEKERIKVKERLDKVVKEILAKISDILDLNLQKGLKKEDSVIKVLEFLKSPYKTTDELIEEKIKLVKMKKALKKSLKSTKKRRSTAEKSPKKKTPKKKKDTDEEGVDNTADDEDEMNEEPEERYEDKGDDYYDDSSKKKKRKRASREVKSDEPSPKKGKGQKKRGSNKKAPKEKKPRGRARAEKPKEPSDEDLREAITELLQKADFSKVTFTDVMKQLGERFKLDLTYMKSHLKALIQEEIARLVGEGEDEDEDSNTEAADEKTGKQMEQNDSQDNPKSSEGDGEEEDDVDRDKESNPTKDEESDSEEEEDEQVEGDDKD